MSAQIAAPFNEGPDGRRGIRVIAMRRRHVQGRPRSRSKSLELPNEKANAGQWAVWIIASIEKRLHGVEPPL